MLSNGDSVLAREKVENSMDEYAALFEGQTGKHSANGLTDEKGAVTSAESIKKRQEGYRTMVNNFYDLVTDFYEYGCRLGMKPGVKALDVGCGVGGPMRNMAIFSGASIEGITINEYQVKVGNKYHAQQGVADIAHTTRGDFQNLPGFADGELWEGIDYGDMDWTGKFDVAYEIEATCHSPDKTRCFSEVARCLKPGGLFAGYEWVVLPDRGYDGANPTHVAIKEGIEIGNGLPTLATPEKVVAALEAAGFEVLEHYDANRNVHSPVEIPGAP
ncbi:sterol 24-C-methyltransferase [Aureococcus anophagefferens]|nr:sterol 24-C-methyltransferase [Aureococcus anophagefferens]